MLSEKNIRNKIQKDRYFFSRHADQERQNDNLLISDVEEAILNGRILEKYPNTGRGESCLVAGFTEEGKPIHIVCGMRGDFVVIVML